MLTNRQLQILQVIVDDFVTSAQPVGSRQISKKEWITSSPATIRNEMAERREHVIVSVAFDSAQDVARLARHDVEALQEC